MNTQKEQLEERLRENERELVKLAVKIPPESESEEGSGGFIHIPKESKSSIGGSSPHQEELFIGYYENNSEAAA